MTARRLAAPVAVEHDWDSLQFKAIFAMSFVVFLFIAAIARLTPTYWRTDAPHRSIFADACASAGTTAQIALSG